MSACAGWLAAAALLPAVSFASEHVAPDPPKTHVDHDMPYAAMAEMMGMDDRAWFSKVMFDELEARGDDTFGWDAAAWVGGDMNRLWIETEGERRDGHGHARVEALWDRVASRWWNLRTGLRHDSGDGPSRTWASFGVAGLAPGFIELEASVFIGESGRTALRIQADYDLLLTQRLVLHPELEVNAYDEGASDLDVGLRLRYEIRREIAPYLGFGWTNQLREDTSELRWVAGIRLWF
jgi:copper resistance protein B